jgi:hypothetical protein
MSQTAQNLRQAWVCKKTNICMSVCVVCVCVCVYVCAQGKLVRAPAHVRACAYVST